MVNSGWQTWRLKTVSVGERDKGINSFILKLGKLIKGDLDKEPDDNA